MDSQRYIMKTYLHVSIQAPYAAPLPLIGGPPGSSEAAMVSD